MEFLDRLRHPWVPKEQGAHPQPISYPARRQARLLPDVLLVPTPWTAGTKSRAPECCLTARTLAGHIASYPMWARQAQARVPCASRGAVCKPGCHVKARVCASRGAVCKPGCHVQAGVSHASQFSWYRLFLEPGSLDSGAPQHLEEAKPGQQAEMCSGHLDPSPPGSWLHQVPCADFCRSSCRFALWINGSLGTVILPHCLKLSAVFVRRLADP